MYVNIYRFKMRHTANTVRQGVIFSQDVQYIATKWRVVLTGNITDVG